KADFAEPGIRTADADVHPEGARTCVYERVIVAWRPSRRIGGPGAATDLGFTRDRHQYAQIGQARLASSRRRAPGCGIGVGPRLRLLTMRPRGAACASN